MTPDPPNDTIEYRICWSASSNHSFRGCSEWEEWDGTPDDVDEAMCGSSGLIPEGLGIALEASGFEWSVETRVGGGS